MPIYEEEGKVTRDDLFDLRKRNKCKECGARLDVFLDFDSNKAFLACADWHRTHHEGIEREASRYEREGLASLTIQTRREILNEQYGEAKTRALTKYMGVVSLTKPQALEILTTIYPDAPEVEIKRAVLLCATEGLNPLMNHVFLIPFNQGKQNETWATVIGIKAKRLMASRRKGFGYLDDTPRLMTEKEQVKIFGAVESGKLWVITKVVDEGGNVAPGYGWWPADKEPFGTDKGNSKFNMAAIRSESQALDRLCPGEMPQGFEVMAEEVAEQAVKSGGLEVTAEPVVEGEAREVKEAPSQETQEPDLDAENPVTKAQIDELEAIMVTAGVDHLAVGRYMMKDKQWKISRLSDLKQWQFKELLAAIKKGMAASQAE